MTESEIYFLIGKWAGYIVTTFLASLLGAYFGAYAKKSAENKAIHENLKNLVEEMKAVTTATKEIEARISNEFWGRQTRWEVQKAALLDSLRELAGAETLVWKMLHAFTNAPTESDVDKAHRANAEKEFLTGMQEFWRSKLATGIVCGKRISDQLDVLDHAIARVKVKAQQRQISDAWDLFDEVQAGKRKLGEIIREDLGFER
jgi:hypothetical protein